MKNLNVTGGELGQIATTYYVDVEFEKDGTTYEANITITKTYSDNIGYTNWEHHLSNEDELPELTEDEKELLFNEADHYEI